jgi:hypothetical protein
MGFRGREFESRRPDQSNPSTRAERTWHERMTLLEQLGFIKSQKLDNRRFALVLLIEPFVAVKALKKNGLVDAGWVATYEARRIKNKEHTQSRASRDEATTPPDGSTTPAAESGATEKTGAKRIAVRLPVKKG